MMAESNAGRRKMMRGMSPGGGSPFHDALPAGGPHGSRASQKRTDRAAKKQIKTREERAARREES